MIRRSTLRSIFFRISLGVCATAMIAPVVTYSASAEAKRKKKSRGKARKAAKARARAKKKAAAAKVENEKHSKNLGAIERLDQIAVATQNEELKKTMVRIKAKEAERHALNASQ